MTETEMLFIEFDSTVETLFASIYYAGKFARMQTVINLFYYFGFVLKEYTSSCVGNERMTF